MIPYTATDFGFSLDLTKRLFFFLTPLRALLKILTIRKNCIIDLPPMQF